MNSVTRLAALKSTVSILVPEAAEAQSIWLYLGWDLDASKAYAIAKEEEGIDIRPLIAPEFSDIVSIVVDAAYGFPYAPSLYSWEDILNGEVPAFAGKSPKLRMLSVIDCALRNSTLC